MKLPELQQMTLQVLRDLYTRFQQDVYNKQFLQDLSTGGIANRVALLSYKAGLWKPSQPLTKENEIYAGDAFPAEDVSTVRSIIWRFVGLGMLTPRMMTDDRSQFFELSSYGQQVLQETEESPYDPLGFMRQLSADSPNLETNSIEYVQEAVNCFLGRYLRAATVMIGLASENEILKLIEVYGNTLNSKDKDAFDKKISSCRNLKQRFDAFYNRLCQDRRDLPIEIRELETWLQGIFQVIRLSRNDAGHPIGVDPTSEGVFANIVLFRTYARHLSKLKSHLASKVKSAA